MTSPTTLPTSSPTPTEKCTTFLFYGTLMAPSVLSRVTSHSTLHPNSPLSTPRPAILHHHQRHRVRYADYPAVIPSSNAGACVRGTVVSGFEESDIWRLDTFEGEQYVRSKVKVEVLPPVKGTDEEAEAEIPEIGKPRAMAQTSSPHNNISSTSTASSTSPEEIEAYTYIWCAPHSELEDQEWDYDEFVREKMWRWAGRHGDSGFDDVDRLEAEQDVGREVSALESGRDPTGGRMVNGAFEKAMRSAGGVGVGDEGVGKREKMESVVERSAV